MGTKNKALFDRAYARMTEIYGERGHAPDPRIVSRFFHEKMHLQESRFYMMYLDFARRMRQAMESKGERLAVRGTAGSSFIAYLLGATDVNPLPRHRYCPRCGVTVFEDMGTAFDSGCAKCPCGARMVYDGHDIPFESNLKSVRSEHIQLGVSRAFFPEAKRMIYDEMWDSAIVTLHDGREISPTWFCFLDREGNDDGEHVLAGNAESFDPLPRITLVPVGLLDSYRELESATGVRMEDACDEDGLEVFAALIEGKVEGIPHLDCDFLKSAIAYTRPHSLGELLQLVGFAHGTNVWTDNGEILYDNHRMSLHEIPAYREDVYRMIFESLQKKGIYETGLAYEVMEKARQGAYAQRGRVDGDTVESLLSLGFDMDFIALLERIRYMFPKAHGVSCLREAIAMTWYKMNFEQQYSDIMCK